MTSRLKRMAQLGLSLILHQVGCCLRPKRHGIRQFRRQYKLMDQIGRGGFGQVYQGYRLSDGMPVAIKFIRHRQVTEWTFVGKQLMPAEVFFLEQCQDSPGVVHLVDWFSGKRGFLIVMERPQRFMDLFDLLNIFGRLDEPTAKDLFGQVVKTTVDLYERHSVVHRDIKDENIVLDMDTGKAWLCDFGAAEFLERVKQRQFQGTRSYCPPEVLKRKCYLPMEGTVWSLGILLYTLLTGYPPFRGEDQICEGQLRFPEYISQECRSLLLACLCPTPEFRITLGQLQKHNWLANGGISAATGIHRFWDRHRQQRMSFGTGRTESESEEEECSYRASTTGEGPPNPICVVPLSVQRFLSANGDEEWGTSSADLNERDPSTVQQPDSGFDTASEALLLTKDQRRSLAMATTPSIGSSQDRFSSAYSSSFYSLQDSLQDFVQSSRFPDCASMGSVVSSTYFSTTSTGPRFSRWETDEAEENDLLTMVQEVDKRNVEEESSEDEETIRANLGGYFKEPR